MTINLVVLHQARDALARDLGSLDDVREEVRNTLANIYYKFHLVAANPRDPAAALNTRGGDMVSRYRELMLGMGQITSDYKFAAELVQSMRRVRAEKPELFYFLQTHFLDRRLLYVVVAGVSAVRRSIVSGMGADTSGCYAQGERRWGQGALRLRSRQAAPCKPRC